jgi:hypothetical protein
MTESRNFSQLTAPEKLAARMDAWRVAEHISFKNPQSQAAYQARVTRLCQAIKLEKPDRVPAVPVLGVFPAFYAGFTVQEALYDYAKMALANRQFVLDFDPDVNAPGSGFVPGKALEMLDYRMVRWAGHGLKDNISYQYLEAEYMLADEYDDLIRDPSAFMLYKYLGRICKNLEPLKKLPNLFCSQEIVPLAANLPLMGDPEIQASLKVLMEAGNEALKWSQARSACILQSTTDGYPLLDGGASKAPFDLIGDTLRGTVGVMKDMYRQPEKLIQAMERLTPLMIKMGLDGVKWGGSPIISIPLHKGSDVFMSDEQYRKFYWPSLKAVCLGLMHEGLVPRLFAEGGFNSRLELIQELPPACALWYFDKTDLSKAKAVMGKSACIMGNVPASMLVTGTPQKVQKYCLNLIETVGRDGGFMLSAGSVLDEVKPENLRMMIETARTSGRY